MANILRRLKIREVSSVDRGAGEGVRVMLFKRALSEAHPTGDAHPSKPGKKKPRPQTLFVHQEQARAAFGNKPSEGAKDRRGKQRHLKRDTSMPTVLPPAVEAYLKRNVIAEAEAVAKRQFSPKQRQAAAAAGAAMPGGGYPIQNVGDLHNAIQAIGRAKNPGKTRAHIRSRAAALGQSALVPESWGKRFSTGRGMRGAGGAKPKWLYSSRRKAVKKVKALLKMSGYLGAVARVTKDAVSFDEMLGEMGSTDFAEGVIEAVRDACHALKDSIESIAECDDLMPNERAEAISESFSQFMDHLSGIAPDNVTKALKEGAGKMSKLTKKMAKAFHSVPAHDATPPAKDKDVKIDNDADKNVAEPGANPPKTATTKQLRKMATKLEKRAAKAEKRLAAALTLSKAEQDYAADPDADMDDDKKKAFLDMTPKERAKFMKDYPLATIAAKRLANLPEPVRKQLEQSGKDSVELAKRVEADEVRTFAKRATDVGQPEAFGAHLRILAKGTGTEEERTKAFDEVMKAMEASATQAKTAGLFSTFGTGRGATGTAWDQLMSKAEELRNEVNKTNGSHPLTIEQAFEKVFTDTANRELVSQYNQEKRRAA